MKNTHPNIQFKIIGYRTIDYPDRLSDGRLGNFSSNEHLFPDGSPQLENAMAKFPLGSMHDHVPIPPCRYEIVFIGDHDMAEEKAQLSCRNCYPPSAPE